MKHGLEINTQLDFGFGTPIARRKRLINPIWSPALREQFKHRLARYLKSRVFSVKFNDNNSTIISVKERYGMLELSVHHMFIEANDAVLAALAEYVTGGSRLSRRLDTFIDKQRMWLARQKLHSRHKNAVSSMGRHYDLLKIRDCLARKYFSKPMDVDIGWGRRRKKLTRRSIRLGSYSFEDRLIRIHPVLDDHRVPSYVVVAVVYHEMLHHALGTEKKNGRRMVHTAQFRRRERMFVHFEKAEQWEKENLTLLLKDKFGPR